MVLLLSELATTAWAVLGDEWTAGRGPGRGAGRGVRRARRGRRRPAHRGSPALARRDGLVELEVAELERDRRHDGRVTELALDEAVPLAHALVDRVAVDHDVRVLFIKGPAAAGQGLRPARPSVDVDVLVDPSRRSLLAERADRPGLGRREPVPLAHRAAPCTR